MQLFDSFLHSKVAGIQGVCMCWKVLTTVKYPIWLFLAQILFLRLYLFSSPTKRNKTWHVIRWFWRAHFSPRRMMREKWFSMHGRCPSLWGAAWNSQQTDRCDVSMKKPWQEMTSCLIKGVLGDARQTRTKNLPPLLLQKYSRKGWNLFILCCAGVFCCARLRSIHTRFLLLRCFRGTQPKCTSSYVCCLWRVRQRRRGLSPVVTHSVDSHLGLCCFTAVNGHNGPKSCYCSTP